MKVNDAMIDSIVIVECEEGYKAHLRFKDSSLDVDVAADDYKGIHARIWSVVHTKCAVKSWRQY